jgi:hypothetical protein
MPRAEIESMSGGRLLVVDDEEINLEIIEEYLNGGDFRADDDARRRGGPAPCRWTGPF